MLKRSSVGDNDEVVKLNINATQFTGIVCFGAVALCTFCALLAAKESGKKKFWVVTMIFYTGLWFEILLSNRHHLTNFLRTVLKQQDLYQSKEAIQTAVLSLAGLLIVLVMFALLRIWRRNQLPERIASLATTMLCGVFIVEIVSLHATDAVLYSSVPGVMFIAYLWAACTLLVLIAAIARIVISKA
jgi:hypothetical protein